MQFTVTAAAFLALFSSAVAQTENFDAISAPAKGEVVTADGKTATTITWDHTAEYDGQKVSILLLQGATENTLDFYPGDNVASSIDSALGTYEWTPDASIAGFETYGLKLQLDSDTTIFQYSFPFKIAAGSSSSDDDTTTSSSAPITTTSTAVTTSTVAKNNNNAASSDVPSTFTSTTSSASATETSSSSSSSSNSGSSSSDADSSSAGTTAAQTTFATAPAATATGSSATSSSSSPVVTAGAARVVAGGFAAVGGVMAMLVL